MQITVFLMTSKNIDFIMMLCEHVQVIFLFVHMTVTYE